MTEKYSPQGNLMAYKIYTRPTARRIYGYASKRRTKHQKNIQNMLQILFVNGQGTTWDMARTCRSKTDHVREQEKIFRRLIKGRYDRGRYSNGAMEMGLVAVGKGPKKQYATYRLSLYGILYYMDAFDPTQKETDAMASKYAHVLPKVFGRWGVLKEMLGEDVYNIRILAKGLYLNNINMARADVPLYELMSYIHIKYRRNFEAMSEEDLAEQISYWFYTFLLYEGRGDRLKKALAQDTGIRDWYADFFIQASRYYEQRLLALRHSKGMIS